MDSTQFREHFRGLDDLVHLASCSQGAVSDRLDAELTEYRQTLVEHGAAWDQWMVKAQRARELFAAHIGAGVDDVAIVASASEGAYQVASTQVWSERPELVTTDMEFPSVAHVWLAQQPRGARVSHVADRDWSVDCEDYAASPTRPGHASSSTPTRGWASSRSTSRSSAATTWSAGR
jgi:selenocysteine lyase/cysteine desulfurase